MIESRRIKGSALVEVLVSMVIIAIALLGHSQMIGKSMKYSTQTAQSTQADILSREIIEQVLNNASSSTIEVYTGDIPSADPGYCKSNSGDECTDLQLASQQLWDWNSNVKKVMPVGDTEIDYDSGRSELLVKIFWNPDGLPNRVKNSDCLPSETSSNTNGNGSEEELLCYQVKVALYI